MADDNKELTGFLEEQFKALRAEIVATKDGLRAEIASTRAEIADAKEDMMRHTDTRFEEAMRHTGVLIEAVRHDIQTVIEGVMGINERLDRHTGEHEQEHAQLEKRILINTADISKLDQRVVRLEGKSSPR